MKKYLTKQKMLEISEKTITISKTMSTKAYSYIKQNKNNKPLIIKIVASIAILAALLAIFSKNETVQYHYTGNSYVKEVRHNGEVVKRQWCTVNRERTVTSDSHIYYDCERTIVEFNR